ncbi:MAG TPA: hypothetical protein VJB57_21750 [Dehalococcoidia bacterium]|nr:hypothetical protein [Dehalococcoidia bacterium]
MLTWRDAEEDVELRWLEAMWGSGLASEVPPAMEDELPRPPLRSRLAVALLLTAFWLDQNALKALERRQREEVTR